MTDLKPCPFPKCGSTELRTIIGGNNCAWVECQKCGAEGPMRDSPEEAEADWNAAHRLTPTEKAELEAAVEFGNAVNASRNARQPTAAEAYQLGCTLANAGKQLHDAAKLLARERREG